MCFISCKCTIPLPRSQSGKKIIVMGMEKQKKRYVQTGYVFDPVLGLNLAVFSSVPVCGGASLNSDLLPQALSK